MNTLQACNGNWELTRKWIIAPSCWAGLARKQIDEFTELARKNGAGGLAYITFENGEAKGPVAKFLKTAELQKIKDRTGASDGDAVFFGADLRQKVNKVLGAMRIAFADALGLKNPQEVALCWIVDFPLYEQDEETGKIDFCHNPFSMPNGGLKALRETENKLDIIADQYDMALNGLELCSGAVRNYDPEITYEAFGVLGYSRGEVEKRFGGILNAFKFGAPPHAGCAFGLDRMLMELLNVESIRDIVAFPKNGAGVDLMMKSPSVVDEAQLEELGIDLKDQE